MDYDTLQKLKTSVHLGEIAASTALDRLYEACLKEIAEAYERFENKSAPESSSVV